MKVSLSDSAQLNPPPADETVRDMIWIPVNRKAKQVARMSAATYRMTKARMSLCSSGLVWGSGCQRGMIDQGMCCSWLLSWSALRSQWLFRSDG